ncbi:MAG: LamG-like jellyroll fold domain-containing protein [Sedimentisphaerales bacterium]
MKKFIVLLVVAVLTVPAWADYKSTILADNPLSFWEFEDASSADGAPCADTVGISNGIYKNRGATATGLPDISLVAGVPGTGGKAAYFNGTGASGNGNFVDVPDSSYTVPPYRLESSTTCSIEFWEKANPTASETYARFISHAAGGTGNYWVGMTSTGANAGQPFVGVPGTTWYAWPPILANNLWHLVDVVYTNDGTNTTATLYIDALNRGSSTHAGLLTPPGAWQDLMIGAENHQTYAFNGLVGAMDEVAYYAYALDQTKVTAHFDAIPEPATITLLCLGGLALLKKRS